MSKFDKGAPSSCLSQPIFMIGRDCKGNWVAQAQNGARGGLFVNRESALKFARSESGNRAVVMVSGVLELAMTSLAGMATSVPAEERPSPAPAFRQVLIPIPPGQPPDRLIARG